MDALQWLNARLPGVSIVVSIFSNLATVLALFLTGYIANNQFALTNRQIDQANSQIDLTRQQVSQTNSQIELTRQSVQNALIYQMQKDERSVGDDFFNGKTTITEPIFVEMQSVFLQRKLGSIPDNAWKLFEQDFCQLMARERLKRDWETLQKGIFSPDFVSYVTNLTSGNSGICGGKP
jgi:hypothetical protein